MTWRYIETMSSLQWGCIPRTVLHQSIFNSASETFRWGGTLYVSVPPTFGTKITYQSILASFITARLLGPSWKKGCIPFLARMQGICIWQFKTLFAANSPLGFLEFCCTKHVYSHGAFVRILSVIKEHLLYSKSDKKRR